MCQRGATRGCYTWKPKCDFKFLSHGRWSNLCKECMQNQKAGMTHRQKVAQSVKMANDRARQRGCVQKDMLKVVDACNDWTGFCAMCEISITLDVGGTSSNRAVIDRVDCKISTYKNNMQWMCTICNNRKQQNTFHLKFHNVTNVSKLPAAGHGKNLRMTYVHQMIDHV